MLKGSAGRRPPHPGVRSEVQAVCCAQDDKAANEGRRPSPLSRARRSLAHSAVPEFMRPSLSLLLQYPHFIRVIPRSAPDSDVWRHLQTLGRLMVSEK